MPRSIPAALALAALSLAAPVPALGQSIFGITGPAVRVDNTAGPAAGPCAYPNGPLIGGFPLAPAACPGPGPFPPPWAAAGPQLGDVTVDRRSDLVWATDGMMVGGYTKAGVLVASFPNMLPGPLTGLGYQAASPFAGGGPVLWLTDGFVATAVIAPPVGACPGAAVPVIGLFAVAFPGLCTDIDYDPTSGALFESNANGLVATQTIIGAPGPFPPFAPAVAGCPVGAPGLTGIAVDTASCMALFVTNGAAVARVDFFGAAAPVTFYAPFPCWPYAGAGPTSGLAFDATPIDFCKGCDATTVVPPKAGSVGQALTPQPAFALRLSGAMPGGAAFLLLGAAPACPVVPVGFGCAICIAPLVAVVGPIPVPASGSLALPAPIPAGLGCSGATAFVQWLVAKPAGGLQTSQALHVRPAVP